MLQDLRYALRLIGRTLGFSATALLTIATGIGATTAVFSVVDNVLLRPLPYPQADRLVRVWEENPGAASSTGAMSGNRWLSDRTFRAWMDRPRTIDLLGSYSSYRYRVAVGGDLVGLQVSPISPTLLGAVAERPLLGRLFDDREGRAPSAAVAILGERLWRDRLAADPNVIGRSLTIEGEPHTIIGVLPSAFRFPDRDTQVWVPLAINGAFTAVARLRPGVTPQEAEAEGTAAARSVPRPATETFAFGSGGGPVVVHARRLDADTTMEVRPALLVLATAVGLVLLVACANVANLLLSQGVGRQREIAVRSALGASGRRLSRQLLTESGLLAMAGGAVGVGVAWLLVRLAPVLAPVTFPRLTDIQMNAGVLWFAVGTTIVTALVTGLIPARRATHLNLFESLRGGDVGSGCRGAKGWRDALLVTEASFAVVLLVGATLLAHSFIRLLDVDAGYDAAYVLGAQVQMPRGASVQRTRQLVASTLEQMRATRGVVDAGAGDMMPFLRMTAISRFRIPPDVGAGTPIDGRALTYIVTPGYAEALRLRLRGGRLFDERDRDSGVLPMLVNEAFVHQYLGRGAVVGRRFENVFTQKGTTEVIGVLANVLKDGNDTHAQPEIYFVDGNHQQIEGLVSFVVRTSGDPASMAGRLRATIHANDPGALIDHVAPLATDRAASMADPRFAATVLMLFAVVAVLLAALGLSGVLSDAVSQRVRELAIRSALGATKRDLSRLIVLDGLTVTGLGIALGLGAAAMLAQFMRSALFGITPYDPVSFAIAPAVLVPIATLACLLPARRAAIVDPARALRGD